MSSSSNNHRIITSSSNGTQACAACKYQRRKCASDCILAPYFPHDKPKQFLNAHKLFGVKNITKVLRELSPEDKDAAINTIIFLSDMRVADPVNGTCRIIKQLEHQIHCYTFELELVLHQLAICRAREAAVIEHSQVLDPQDDMISGGGGGGGLRVVYDCWGLQDDNSSSLTDGGFKGNNIDEDVKPAVDMLSSLYEQTQVDPSWEMVQMDHGIVPFVDHRQSTQSEEIIFKEDNVGLEEHQLISFHDQQVPEDDLKTAATFFTLTS
ncbi:hypothetical protein Dimus_004167 [Dionaea muscipula]